MNSVTDIANEIYTELGSPPDVSVASIAYWLRTNIGGLNNLVNGNYEVIGSLEITPNIGDNEKFLFKKLYNIHFLTIRATSVLYAASIDIALEVTDAFATVKTINRNELAKVYNTLKKDAQEELKKFLNLYKFNRSTPLQVTGDDSVIYHVCYYNKQYRLRY